jgi:hypothetical protein
VLIITVGILSRVLLEVGFVFVLGKDPCEVKVINIIIIINITVRRESEHS